MIETKKSKVNGTKIETYKSKEAGESVANCERRLILYAFIMAYIG